MPFKQLLLVFSVLSLNVSCAEVKPLAELLTKRTAREKYERQLLKEDDANSLRVQSWREQGLMALTDSAGLTIPHFEKGYWSDSVSHALGYRLALQPGVRLRVAVDLDTTDVPVFIDLYRLPNGNEASPEHLVSAEQGTRFLSYEPEETGFYQLRIQAALGRAAGYELIVQQEPVYGFPVAGKGNIDIWSKFGDPRGGGARRHEGIDIFAARGTPVVAVTRGRVGRVADRSLGGKQVWVRDGERGYSLYYAHLDSQLVSNGQLVLPGDTLGLVGNTGNAARTAPHLHFGIYRRGRGAIDPYPFVYRQVNTLPPVLTDLSPGFAALQTIIKSTNLRLLPNNNGEILEVLSQNTKLSILGATGKWYHVRTPEGRAGYVYYTSVEEILDNETTQAT